MSNSTTPAFPIVTPDMPVEGSPGLTKREYIATKLAAALVEGGVARGCPGHEWPDAMVQGVKLADKLLAELAK